jgi:hypothetical protein
MRARQMLLLLGSTSALFAALLPLVPLAAGCGGSSSSSTTTSDSGADGTTIDAPGEATVPGDAGMEASEPVGSSDASAAADALPLICQIDADISNLNVPDASIGDSGVNVASCYSCITTTCGKQVSACNADCTCKVNVESFVVCSAAGGSLETCATKLTADNDPSTTGLFECLALSCAETCGGGAL